VFEGNATGLSQYFSPSGRSSAMVLKELDESVALTGASQLAVWRSRPVVGYFDKKEHFASMAARAGGEVDAR